MSELESWLQKNGLSQYLDVFVKNDIEYDLLEELTDDDLKDLGLSLGHRRRLLKSIRSKETGVGEAESLTEKKTDVIAEPNEWQAEKRFLSLVLCDLVDSTKLAASMDVEDIHLLNRTYLERCTEVVKRHGGYVAKYMGDGVLSYFGYPNANENDAERAVSAGLEIVEIVKTLNGEVQLPNDLSLSVRVGIASGLVVVESMGEHGASEYAVVGEAPNIAARLEQQARKDSVLIGPDTYKLVGDSFEFIDRGEITLKGYQHSLHTWQVVGSRSLDEQFSLGPKTHLTELIGRDEEYKLLISRWKRSLSGAGQVVLLSGEAGIGKTRLMDALLDGVTEKHHRVRFFCHQNYAQSPLHPVVNNLLRESQILNIDSVKKKREKLTRLLQEKYRWSNELIHTLLSIALLLDAESDQLEAVNPEHALQTLQYRLVDMMIDISKECPLLLVVEDAHWIDPSSRRVLDLLVEKVHEHRILLLVSSRLEKSVEYVSSNVTRLSLTNLTKEHATELIRSLTAGQKLPMDTVFKISEKTDGIPLFLEEVTKAFVDDVDKIGAAQPDSDGVIPDTLQASLLAKLDRLEQGRMLAQYGAVIGNSFGKNILAHVCERSTESLSVGLDELVSNRIAVRESSEGGDGLRFRHALVRDAAYESLLRKNRVLIHATIAEYLNKIEHRDERSNQSIVAYHYEKALMFKEAFLSWLVAGKTALESGASVEAVELLRKAWGLLDTELASSLDRVTLYDFYMSQGKALNAAKGAVSVVAKQAFENAVDTAAAMKDIERQVDALDYLFGITFNSGNFDKSIECAQKMLEIGGDGDHKIAIISGYQGLGMAYCTLGQFDLAERNLSAALKYEKNQIKGINCYPSMTMDYLSFVRYFLGNKEDCRALCEEAIGSATSESKYATATALSNSCFSQMMLGNYKVVQEYSSRAIRLAAEIGQLMLLNRASLFNNLSTAWIDESTEKLDKVVSAIDILFHSEEYIDLTYLIGMTAELQVHLGRYEQALELIRRAIDLSDKTGEKFYHAELLRLMAIAMHKTANAESKSDQPCSDEYLNLAEKVAKQQGAFGWIERITATRNKISQEQGK